VTQEVIRPDPKAILKGLKKFQRDTVEYVFQRMYLDDEPTHRFLIADEVGLGKTMVARGLIAKVLDHLWDEVPRIDIVYICSNNDIARQNVRKLNVTNKGDAAIASRITMLPMEVADLGKSHVNLVSFTPATSLDLKSNLGKAEERALLYWMLKKEWQLSGAAPKNVFQGYAGLDNFRDLLDWFDRESIDDTLQKAFHAALATVPDIRERFAKVCDVFGFARKHIPEEDRALQRTIVGELRGILAKTCIRALEPDLVILDEFQRFKHLLTGQDDAGLLARSLFEYSDDVSKARVVLLSATPYKMYTLTDEGGDEDHYADFFRTAEFLLDDKQATQELHEVLSTYRRELFRLGENGTDRLVALKNELETRLRGVMVRTERLAASGDRDGMLTEVACRADRFEKSDPLAYRALQQVATAVEHGDTIEYWKSAPYVLNFMDDYELKTGLKEAVKDGHHKKELEDALTHAERLLLPWREVEAYAQVDPGNARMRWLFDDVINRDAWKVAWVPPSLPYYKLDPPFSNSSLVGFTKKLVFSSWRVVPKTIAALLSYEAERRMMLSGPSGEKAENTAEARKRRRGLLQFTKTDGRLTGMPVLGLLYPSVVLARDYDPLKVASDLGLVGLPDASAVVEETRRRLEPRVAKLIAKAKTQGPEDEAWYWAALLMLDNDEAPDAIRDWRSDPDLADHWAGESENDEDEGVGELWREHVLEFKNVALRVMGKPPADLAVVLARMAVAGPAVAALRALGRVSGGAALEDLTARKAAGRIAWGFRAFFNIPEVMALIRGMNAAEPYWQRVLDYGVAGCLQAALDEYAHILHESQGLVDKPVAEIAGTLSEIMRQAISLRTAALVVDEIGVSKGNGGITFVPHRMRARFAARLSEDEAEAGGKPTRADQVRTAFNSPFWPFVLATTSVGQEGLDFHQYCHAVVHWNLPTNPVDLEQREGRVHRYKGHAVRKNVAAKHADAELTDNDPWTSLFAAAAKGLSTTESGLVPYWVYATPGGARIERHVPAFPLSREIGQMNALRKSLAVYRMVFGQPRQEDLLAHLLRRVPSHELSSTIAELLVDLRPRI
jgi:hypothetical protein